METLDRRPPLRRRTRRAFYCLANAKSGGGTTALADALIRHLVRLPVSTTRWRLSIANRTPDTAAGLAVAVSVNGVWVGAPGFYASGTFYGWPTGKFAAAPAQALAGFSTPADGTRYTSQWVTDPALQFAAHARTLLSFGVTGGSSVVTAVGTTCFASIAGGAAALADSTTVAPSAQFNKSYFDMRIEYETVTDRGVVLVVGDSLANGSAFTAGSTTVGANGNLTDQSWPVLYGILSGQPTINLGYSGAATATFTGGSSELFSQLGLGDTCIPDVAILALGANDFNGSLPTNLSSYTNRVVQLLDTLRGFGIGAVYLTTVMPRNFLHGTITTGVAGGVTSVSTSISFPTGHNVSLGYGTASAETLVTSGASTGSGPYTTTFATSTVNAHSSGENAWSAGEAFRRTANDVLLRQVPYTASGCLDLDAVMASPADVAQLDTRWSPDPDGTHGYPPFYQRIAQAIPTRLAV